MWPTTSRQSRGYGAEHDRNRKVVMMRDQYSCVPCAKQGRVTEANEMDHIVPKAKGGTDSLSNLQAICRDCHKAKTQKETGKALLLKQPTGLDGWPI